MKASYIFLLISSIFVSSHLYSSHKTDSLNLLIDTTKSIELKTSALNTIAWDIKNKSAKTADSIARIALSLAEVNNIENQIANAINTLGVLDLMKGKFEEGVEKLEKCARINKKLGHYTPYIDNKMNISLAYYFQGKLDSSIALLTDLYKLADSLDRPRNVALILGNLGPIYQERGYYLKSLEIAIKNIITAKELKDTLMLSKVYNSVALLYDYFGEFDKSIYYHKKGLKLDSITGSIKGLSSTLGNLGEVYLQVGKKDSACILFHESLRLAEQSGDSGSITGQLINIASCLAEDNQLNSADSILSICLKTSRRLNYGYHISMTLQSLGSVNFQLKHNQKAHSYYLEALKSSTSDGYAEVIESSYKGLSETYKSIGNPDSALFYLQKYILFSDSIKSVKDKDKIELLETQYRTTEKENKILKLNEERVLDKLAINKQRGWIFLLAGLVLIAILLSLLFIQNNRKRAQAEKDAAIIAEQERSTKAIFEMQEEERKRISKDLHDGVGQQLAGLKINFQVIAEKLKLQNPERYEELQQLKEIVTDSAVEIRNISHIMMPIALTNQGILVAMEEMLKKSFGLSSIQYNFEHFGIQERLAENLEVSLYRIAQELINNVIKHSNANHVNIQLFKSAGKIIMIVEDNGEGIKGESQDGHGLMNIKSRLNTLHGEVNFEPSPSSGTLATIRIPI